MKVVEVEVYETVEHRGFIRVPDDFDADNIEHVEAMEALFCDRHEAFNEAVTDRQFVITPAHNHAGDDELDLDGGE